MLKFSNCVEHVKVFGESGPTNPSLRNPGDDFKDMKNKGTCLEVELHASVGRKEDKTKSG